MTPAPHRALASSTRLTLPNLHRGEPWPPLAAAALASGALLLPVAAGWAFGPQRPAAFVWYATLRMPRWKPPDPVIPAAWTLIDCGLAVAAYRLLRAPGGPGLPQQQARHEALAWLALNVSLIGGWSAVFFGARHLPASLLVAAAMVGTGSAAVRAAARVDGVAARATLPFVGWVGFATALTAAIWWLNRRR
ncbi:TspO/MBR family protein [Aquincola tertiaricarbonis]|uniref:TspO/MBR family protein n=1 Tax=Aquincola tertiaricarbonis TaxID=391953 RepID=UPI0006974010|nr:TspO/MBR family protein [Aquincola tertiaricarbonis]